MGHHRPLSNLQEDVIEAQDFGILFQSVAFDNPSWAMHDHYEQDFWAGKQRLHLHPILWILASIHLELTWKGEKKNCKIPGEFREDSGRIPGKFQEFQKNSRRIPGEFHENSRRIPGECRIPVEFQEECRRIPGGLQGVSRRTPGEIIWLLPIAVEAVIPCNSFHNLNISTN